MIDLGPGASIFDAGQEGADHPLEEVTLHLPFAVADYADFYSSLHHASNVGRMFRPDDDPLPPNWRHLPIGYHGRAGTVVPSGTPIARPHGQRGPGDFGPTQRLDVELELGFVIGTPSDGPVPVDRGARPRLRRRAAQRLERARPPGVGVPPARPLPRQVVRDLDQPLGHAARRAARAPPASRRTRRRCPTCARSRGRSTSRSSSSSTAPRSPAPTPTSCTGASPSRSPTSRPTAPPCAPATCSAPARSPAPRSTSAAACSS